MRQARLLFAALGALLALCGLCAALASAEDANAPMLLVTSGKVTELAGSFKGTASSLSTLGGKALTGTGDTMAIKNCKASPTAGEKDTNLCEALLTLTGIKQGTTACRSESSSGKDPVETVLELADVHLATEKNSAGELQILLLLRVLGVAGEEELTVVCGTVKNKLKGTIGCLLTPGLTTVVAGGTFEILCKQNATTHDAETGECEQLCEWLKEHPFETNLGAGFEDTWMNIHLTGSFNLGVFLDD